MLASIQHNQLALSNGVFIQIGGKCCRALDILKSLSNNPDNSRAKSCILVGSKPQLKNQEVEHDIMKSSFSDTTNAAKRSIAGRLFYLAAIGFAAFLATGCASINYRPVVSLGMSPKTIKANVRLETFVDASPQSDKSSCFTGFSTCEPGTLEGELAPDVTDAILTDFNNNQVFENLKKRFDGQPDFVMKGTIHRFYGKYGTTPVFWLTIPADIIWLFGVPIMSDDIKVDLEVSIERPDGTVVGTYRGQSACSKWYNMYQNVQFALPTRMNNTFSVSVSQIRDQIMKDADKLTPKTQ